jgi:hypothetical protein
MYKYFTFIVSLFLLSFVINVGTARCEEVMENDGSTERRVFGWVEKVKIMPYNLEIHAKLDTGADFSSLGVKDLQEFEKDGKPWVSFTVKNRDGIEAKISRPVIRTAIIKGHAKNSKREVVRLGICVGDFYMEEEVNLVNRGKFEFQMLVGRSYLAGKAVVDPASMYLVDAQCLNIGDSNIVGNSNLGNLEVKE